MPADAKQTGEENDSGLDWAKRSLVCSLLGFFVGVVGVPGALLLGIGVLAVACGFIGLRRIPKSRSVWYAKWMVAGGIVLGCFLVLVGLDEVFVPNRMLTKARRTTSLATGIALESAVNNIYTEYGKIPNVGSRVTTNSPEGLKLLNILLGLDAKSDNALNSRTIKFLAVKEGKNNKNGLIYAADGKSVEGLYDPWGSPYTVELDTDYNEQLHFTIGSRVVDLKSRRVAAANSNGVDSFTFKANDGQLDSVAATVEIITTSVNDAPVATAQSVTTAEDTAQAITLVGTDVDPDLLTYEVVIPPTNGTLSGTAPNLTYTPAANSNGADSFTFKANDGLLDSAIATVDITVTAVNDAPVAFVQSVVIASPSWSTTAPSARHPPRPRSR